MDKVYAGMKKTKQRYHFINMIVIFATVVLFVGKYRAVKDLFANIRPLQVVIFLSAVSIVHVIKAGRLYLTLYGSDMDLFTYIRTYCKATPVSVVIPYKIGELFRMYCYGQQLDSYLKGMITILLDRFMDTIALVTMILLIWIFNGWHITSIIYILLLFLLVVVLLYIIFPNVSLFWKRYLLHVKATRYRLSVLSVLDKLDLIYKEITNVSKGRGAILYFLSLIAWGVEIGSVAVVNSFSCGQRLDLKISEYLSSAISGNQSGELKLFIFLSVILLLIIYLVAEIMTRIPEKRNQR